MSAIFQPFLYYPLFTYLEVQLSQWIWIMYLLLECVTFILQYLIDTLKFNISLNTFSETRKFFYTIDIMCLFLYFYRKRMFIYMCSEYAAIRWPVSPRNCWNVCWAFLFPQRFQWCFPNSFGWFSDMARI